MARKISFDADPSDGKAHSVAVTPLHSVRPLLGIQMAPKPAGALSAISRSLDGLSEKAKRADEIEQKLIQGLAIVDLDPATVDASFVPDRMKASEEQDAAFREMIRSHGQTSPILVRPHPKESGRYEAAFGHRRLRAAHELKIAVRAVVRPLSDEELVVAQGQENSGRTDLTYIERARFAVRLEDRRFSREIIMSALNVDKAALSKLIAIATRIPIEIIEAIGPAPGFGRQRWAELAELLEARDGRRRATSLIVASDFAALDTDKRFMALHDGLRSKAARSRPESWNASDGTRAAQVARNGKKMMLVFDDRIVPEFGEFVRAQLQTLYDQFRDGKT